MQEQEIELSVGDTLQIGEHMVTIVEIDGPEIQFRLDSGGSVDASPDQHDEELIFTKNYYPSARPR